MLFEKATKKGLRFSVNKGTLCTEDLWKCSLPTLNEIAKGINKQLKESEEEDFIGTKSKANSDLQLSMDVVKRVIQVRLEEKAAKEKRVANAARLAELKQLASEKAGDALKSKSLDDINAMIAELEQETED